MKFHNKSLVVLFVLLMISSIAADASNRRPQENVGQFNFQVEIDGVVSASFMSVEGLEFTSEVVEYRDGIWAKNPRKIPGVTKYSNIILKRRYIFNDDLWKWRKEVENGNVQRRNGTIIITDENREEIMRFKFDDAWPMRWRLSTLDDKGNKSLIEELEIAIGKLERLSIRR